MLYVSAYEIILLYSLMNMLSAAARRSYGLG